MSTRDIVSAFQQMYGAEVSATLVSKVTESVLERVLEWQSRPLDEVYPIVYLDCIMRMVRNSLRFVSWKDRKAVAADLKKIYQSLTVEEADGELELFSKRWDGKYPSIAKSWRKHWPNLITLFDYPDEIRRVIYITNAIESLNSVIRKAIKNRKIFPYDQSAMKVVYLAINAAAKRWTMPIRNWRPALNRFMIEFTGRIPETI